MFWNFMLLRFTAFIFCGVLKLSSWCPSEEVLFIKQHVFGNLPVFCLSWHWCLIIVTWIVCQSSELLIRRLKPPSPLLFFFFGKFSFSWNVAVPKHFELFMVLWNFCSYSVMLHFRVVFHMEYDILTRFKIVTQLSVLPEHKMCSKHHLNFMITCKT